MPSQFGWFRINVLKTNANIVKTRAGAKKTNPITIKNSDTLPIENSIDFKLFKLLQDLINWIFRC